MPLQNPTEVEAYLAKQLTILPLVERMKLTDDLMERATEMWNGYALWLGDPVAARLELRNDEELMKWSAA